jgi:hypothetical protein
VGFERDQMTKPRKHAKQDRVVEIGVEPTPYRIFTRSGWKAVVPGSQEPPFAVKFRGKYYLVHRIMDDAEFFQKNPSANFRLTWAVPNDDLLDRHRLNYQFNITTRFGGRISGDSYDMGAALSHFSTGTRRQRLQKAVRHLARDVHRVQDEAPDMVVTRTKFNEWSSCYV